MVSNEWVEEDHLPELAPNSMWDGIDISSGFLIYSSNENESSIYYKKHENESFKLVQHFDDSRIQSIIPDSYILSSQGLFAKV